MADIIENTIVEQYPTRDEWLQARRTGGQTFGIGSSDVPAILGISRFQSPLSLYYEKIGVEKPSPAYEEHARWGNILEEPIAQRYAAETKRIIANPNGEGQYTIMRRKDRPFMIASLDRMILGHQEGGVQALAHGMGVLEIKNAHLMMREEWLGKAANNEPPVEYQVQLQHQLAVTGALWGSIAALIGGVIFVWADVPRDEALIAKVIELETEFIRRLEDRDPPPADGHEATTAVLKRLYPKDRGTSIALPAEAIEWHNALQDAKARKKAAEADEDTYANLLKAAIGDNTVGVLPDGTSYSYRLQGRGEFIMPATEYRVLRAHQGRRKGE